MYCLEILRLKDERVYMCKKKKWYRRAVHEHIGILCVGSPFAINK